MAVIVRGPNRRTQDVWKLIWRIFALLTTIVALIFSGLWFQARVNTPPDLLRAFCIVWGLFGYIISTGDLIIFFSTSLSFSIKSPRWYGRKEEPIIVIAMVIIMISGLFTGFGVWKPLLTGFILLVFTTILVLTLGAKE